MKKFFNLFSMISGKTFKKTSTTLSALLIVSILFGTGAPMARADVNDKDITAFTVPHELGATTIGNVDLGGYYRITLTLPSKVSLLKNGIDVPALGVDQILLTPDTFTINGDSVVAVLQGGAPEQDFAQPVWYTVTATNATTKSYAVVASMLDISALTAAINNEFYDGWRRYDLGHGLALNQADYTNASWLTYIGAIAAATSTEESLTATATDATNAVSALAAAKAGLVFAAKADLDTVYNAAAALTQGNYWPTSWTPLAAAMALASSTNAEMLTKTAAIDTATSSLALTDGTPPADFTVGAVTAVGGTVNANQFNRSNTGISVTVPVANDATLVGSTAFPAGTIQLKASRNGAATTTIGTVHTIVPGDVNSTVALSISTTTLYAEFPALTTGDVLTFSAVIVDQQGNVKTGTESATTLTAALTPPAFSAVAISSDNASTTLAKSGDTITVAFTATKTISTPTVTIDGQTATVTNTSGNDWTATYQMTPARPDGSVVFSISNYTDTDGNPGFTTSTTTNASAVTYDNTAPAAFSVGSVYAGGGTVVAGKWNASNTSINVPVPVANDSTLVGGTIRLKVARNGGAMASVGAPHTIVPGDLSSAVTIPYDLSTFAGFTSGDFYNFNAVITDAAGTSTLGTQSTTTIIADLAAPILSVVTASSTNASSTLAKVGDTFSVYFTGNKTLQTPVVSIATHTATTTTNVSGNVWSASYTLVQGDTAGTVPFSITYADAAGNPGFTTSTTTDTTAVTFDKTAPTLAVVTASSTNATPTLAKAGDTVRLSFTASKTIQTPTITIAGHTATTTTNVSGNLWTASYVLLQSDATGTVPFSITYADLAGNAGFTTSTTTDSTAVTFDRAAPTLSAVSIHSDYASTTLANVGNVVTLSFTADEAVQTPVVTIAGHATTTTNAGGNNWTTSYTLVSGDSNGTVPFSIDYTDLAGNAGFTTSTTTDATAVTFDKTAPSAFTVGAVTTIGGTVVANKWNASNTGLTVTTPIANDTSLIGGMLRILVSRNGGATTTLGLAQSIGAGDINTATTTAITASQFEALAGFADGDTFAFSALLTDAAGNVATGTQSANILTADQTNPTVTRTGAADISLHVGDAYTDAGATATDALDGSLTGSVVPTGLFAVGTVTASSTGTTTITYTVADAAGNSATTSRTIEVYPLAATQAVMTTSTTVDSSTPSLVVGSAIHPHCPVQCYQRLARPLRTRKRLHRHDSGQHRRHTFHRARHR